MKPPIMPSTPARETPELWDKYWDDYHIYELWERDQKQKLYRKNYYAEKTRQRQIVKMKELIDKYYDEAKEYFDYIEEAINET